MIHPIKTAATVATLTLGLVGCAPPTATAPPPKPISGVTFLGDKAHPVKIFRLSANGRAAVGYVFDADKEPPPGSETLDGGMPDYVHSFHWTEGGGLKVIRTRDGRDVEVRAISADGSVAAGRYYDATGTAHAFRWTEAGGVEDLGAQCRSCRDAEAATVSGDGAVIFGAIRASLHFDSYRWTRATGARNLHIPGEILAASADGSTAMGVRFVADGEHVFRWSLARGYEDLGAPPGTVASRTAIRVMPTAFSADGSTIVGEHQAKTGGRRGFRWTRAGGYEDLPGDGDAFITGVSGDGSMIVGGLSGPGRDIRTVRWLRAGAPEPLGPPELMVLGLNDISADGRTVAGLAAVGKGDRRAFLFRVK